LTSRASSPAWFTRRCDAEKRFPSNSNFVGFDNHGHHFGFLNFKGWGRGVGMTGRGTSDARSGYSRGTGRAFMQAAPGPPARRAFVSQIDPDCSHRILPVHHLQMSTFFLTLEQKWTDPLLNISRLCWVLGVRRWPSLRIRRRAPTSMAPSVAGGSRRRAATPGAARTPASCPSGCTPHLATAHGSLAGGGPSQR